jgi:hypothetical protein
MSRFRYHQFGLTNDMALTYARAYEVWRLGRCIGMVYKCHDGSWTWGGIDHAIDNVVSTREMAADAALRRYIRINPTIDIY